MSSGTNSRIFGPRIDSDLVSQWTEYTCLIEKLEFILKLYDDVLLWKILFRISGAILFILNISFAKTWKCIWSMETEFPLLNSSKVDFLSL